MVDLLLELAADDLDDPSRNPPGRATGVCTTVSIVVPPPNRAVSFRNTISIPLVRRYPAAVGERSAWAAGGPRPRRRRGHGVPGPGVRQ